MSTLHSTPAVHHPHPLRDAWIAVALSPVVLVVAVGLALALGGGAGSWLGGALLSVVALTAPTVALLEAHRAGRDDVHRAEVALAAAAVAWLVVVAVLVLAVVSEIAALVGIAVSACIVMLGWRPDQRG